MSAFSLVDLLVLGVHYELSLRWQYSILISKIYVLEIRIFFVFTMLYPVWCDCRVIDVVGE